MRGSRQPGQRRLVALLMCLAAMLIVGGASGSATVTIGQTEAGSNVFGGVPGWYVQPAVDAGTDFVVPPGNWNITGWSTYAAGGIASQSMSMMVFRPDGLGRYTVVGSSPVEALTPGTLNSFSDIEFGVQAGDRLGLYDPTGNAVVAKATHASGDIIALGMASTQPGIGALLTPAVVLPGSFRLNISAELTPANASPPTTTISLTPAAPDGSNGWYTHPVGVSVTADGNGSGITATRCALDPATPPSRFEDLAAGCTFLGDPDAVETDGDHEIFAASANAGGNETPLSATFKIDRTAPTVTCATPTPRFLVGSNGGRITASVSDAGSRPVATEVSGSASAASAGARTIDLTGRDNAGNTATVACPYVVGYAFGGFSAPLPTATVKSGSTLPLKFQLKDANGRPINDADAQLLVSQTCRLAISLAEPAGPVPGCPTYDVNAKQFRFNLKTTAAMQGPNRITLTVTLDNVIAVAGTSDPFNVR